MSFSHHDVVGLLSLTALTFSRILHFVLIAVSLGVPTADIAAHQMHGAALGLNQGNKTPINLLQSFLKLLRSQGEGMDNPVGCNVSHVSYHPITI